MSENVKYMLLECGCKPMSFKQPENTPYCVIHDCGKLVEANAPTKGRMARCAYYGATVKRSMYNANCCGKCEESVKSGDGTCHCEAPSSNNLWFYRSRPERDYDEFYCACHGAD